MRKSVNLTNTTKQTRQNMKLMQTPTCAPRMAPATQNLLRERRRERTQERTTTPNKTKGNITTDFREVLTNPTANGRSHIVTEKTGQQLTGNSSLEFKTLAGTTNTKNLLLTKNLFTRSLRQTPQIWGPNFSTSSEPLAWV